MGSAGNGESNDDFVVFQIFICINGELREAFSMSIGGLSRALDFAAALQTSCVQRLFYIVKRWEMIQCLLFRLF